MRLLALQKTFIQTSLKYVSISISLAMLKKTHKQLLFGDKICKTLHEWKDNSVLAEPLAAIYPSMFNSFPVIRTASAKNCRFHVPQPTVLLPWRHLCDYHAICCMDGKTIQCLPNPSQHVPICIQCVSPKIAIFTNFCFPWGCPCGNHAKCYMDGKRFRCLQIASLNVPI